MSTVFELENLTHRYGSFEALRNIQFDVGEGEVLGIVGPNGSGKTTLLKILCGILRGWEGRILFFGQSLTGWKRRTVARRLAYLAQQTRMRFPYTAREVVLMGRLPHQESTFFETPDDHSAVDSALELTGCTGLADRYFSELSGGEQQLVALASALAQEPKVLLLDEPTVFLDLKHQLKIYHVLKDLHDAKSVTIVLVTHDLNLAESFCNRLIFLREGKISADLRREKGGDFAIPPQLLENVFGVSARSVGRGRIILSLGGVQA